MAGSENVEGGGDGTGGGAPAGGTPATGGATPLGGSVNGGSGGTGGTSGGGGATASGGTSGSIPTAGIGGAGKTGCPVELVGFGAVGSRVTGGKGGTVVTVSSAAELREYATRDASYEILIDSMLTLTEQIRPKPNKTFRGVGTRGGLTGGGFYVLDTSNIIIQNLTISKVHKDVGDAITIQASSHVWVDHCDLSSDLTEPKEDYDDLLAVTHGSDFVTVSWTHFHDHYATSLVGHSRDPEAALEDIGHLTVTFHHNWFSNTESNNPRVRFGRVHIFNNLFQDVSANAVISQMGAQVYVEANVFSNVLLPITTVYQDPEEGTATDKDNWYSGSGTNTVTAASTWLPSSSYPYNADSAGSAEFLVTTCAGVGKL